MPTIQIAPAAPADLPAVLALLIESGLPPNGLAEHFGAARCRWLSSARACAWKRPGGER